MNFMLSGFALTGAGLLSALVVSSCGDSTASSQKTAPQPDQPAVTVRIEELHLKPFTETIQLTGVMKAVDDVLISPEEGGTVRRWHVEKGAHVAKNIVLVQLNDDVIRATYDAAEAQYKTSALNYEKQVKVFAEEAISELQLKTAEYARDAARANADLMKARVARMAITSPINGILDDRLVDEGEFAPPGQPIARVVNLYDIKAVINVPERYAGIVTKGTPVRLTVVAYPGEVFTGKVTFIGSTISPDNRTYVVEARLANAGLRLKPDMIARASIVQSLERKALVIGEEIVQQVDKGRYVVYVEQNGKAEERVVEIGGRQGNAVEIVSGLRPGDHIVTAGYKSLTDGQDVTITK